MTNLWPGGGPMLAVNIDDVEIISYPMLGQPKLNGIRACWNGENLVSRRGEVWKWKALPHIIEKLQHFSTQFPNTFLDGEIYCHGMALQDIVSRGSVIRNHAHEGVGALDFHAFDIIATNDTETRQITLSQIYKPWVPVCRVENEADCNAWLKRFVEAGFEGLILRQYKCPYLPNRTEALIKVKPWKYGIAKIQECIEGKDSFANMLGAFRVIWKGRKFKIGGGQITVEQRKNIWKSREKYLGHFVAFRYRDASNSGKPLQPQITTIPVP
jgi:DNA ligase-1